MLEALARYFYPFIMGPNEALDGSRTTAPIRAAPGHRRIRALLS